VIQGQWGKQSSGGGFSISASAAVGIVAVIFFMFMIPGWVLGLVALCIPLGMLAVVAHIVRSWQQPQIPTQATGHRHSHASLYQSDECAECAHLVSHKKLEIAPPRRVTVTMVKHDN
jgi:hypothetical protein